MSWLLLRKKYFQTFNVRSYLFHNVDRKYASALTYQFCGFNKFKHHFPYKIPLERNYVVLIQIAWKRMRKGSRRRLTATFVNICLRIIVNVWYRLFRSSHERCSVKKDVLKNFVNLIGKHLCWSLFLIKLKAQADTPTQVFSCEIYKIFKKMYVEEHLWTNYLTSGVH